MSLKQDMASNARSYMGQPVCIVLKNGTFYVGWVTSVERDEVILSGKQGRGKIKNFSNKRTPKAKVSGWGPFGATEPFFGVPGTGFNPSTSSPFGAPTQAGGGSGGGFINMITKAWPGIRMGIGMIQTIMPLLGGLKI